MADSVMAEMSPRQRVERDRALHQRCSPNSFVLCKSISVSFTPMYHQDAFTVLPEGIWLTNDDALAVLTALDIARAAARNHTEAQVARSAILLVTRKLWDELADVLEMNGDHDG